MNENPLDTNMTIGWLVGADFTIRGTASQVRARGTATDSIQRQNARNRRVPDGVIRRVSNFLSTPMISAAKDSDDIAFEHRFNFILDQV